jgi:hypothetical protein
MKTKLILLAISSSLVLAAPTNPRWRRGKL